MTSRKHILKNIAFKTISSLAVAATVACSGSGTSTSSLDSAALDNTDAAVSAVASIFGGSSTQNLVISTAQLQKMVEQAQDQQECAENDPYCTCTFGEEGPDEVDSTLYGTPGTYGADGYSLDIAAEDFCTLSNGTENSGSGPDGNGLVATFELNSDVEGSCDNDDGSITTMTMQAGSSGVFRNNEDYYPEIYGTFSFLINETDTVDVSCTIFLNDDESIAFAACTDADGSTVEHSDTADCSFNTTDE